MNQYLGESLRCCVLCRQLLASGRFVVEDEQDADDLARVHLRHSDPDWLEQSTPLIDFLISKSEEP